MAAFGVSYEMPSLEISVRNASSVELTAPAVPEVATAATPRAPATSAVPANLVMRFEVNIGLLVDVGLFRVVSGLTSESDGALGGFLDNPWGGKRLFRGYGSAVLEPPIVQVVEVRTLHVAKYQVRVLGPGHVGIGGVGAARDAALHL